MSYKEANNVKVEKLNAYHVLEHGEAIGLDNLLSFLYTIFISNEFVFPAVPPNVSR